MSRAALGCWRPLALIPPRFLRCLGSGRPSPVCAPSRDEEIHTNSLTCRVLWRRYDHEMVADWVTTLDLCVVQDLGWCLPAHMMPFARGWLPYPMCAKVRIAGGAAVGASASRRGAVGGREGESCSASVRAGACAERSTSYWEGAPAALPQNVSGARRFLVSRGGICHSPTQWAGPAWPGEGAWCAHGDAGAQRADSNRAQKATRGFAGGRGVRACGRAWGGGAARAARKTDRQEPGHAWPRRRSRAAVELWLLDRCATARRGPAPADLRPAAPGSLRPHAVRPHAVRARKPHAALEMRALGSPARVVLTCWHASLARVRRPGPAPPACGGLGRCRRSAKGTRLAADPPARPCPVAAKRSAHPSPVGARESSAQAPAQVAGHHAVIPEGCVVP